MKYLLTSKFSNTCIDLYHIVGYLQTINWLTQSVQGHHFLRKPCEVPETPPFD